MIIKLISSIQSNFTEFDWIKFNSTKFEPIQFN